MAGEERTPDSESGESEASVLGSARPGGGQDYPRLKLQLSEKEAQLAKTRAEAQASASEAERLQGALAKAKRQLAVREKEKDAAVKVSSHHPFPVAREAQLTRHSAGLGGGAAVCKGQPGQAGGREQDSGGGSQGGSKRGGKGAGGGSRGAPSNQEGG